MQKNYSVFLKSAAGRNYQESIDHVMDHANYIWKGEDYTVGGSCVREDINLLKSGLGNSLFIMENIGEYYEAKSSSDLLLYSDIKQFKQDIYVAAKLRILGSKEPLKWVQNYWSNIMSDNPFLIHYLINYKDSFEGKYRKVLPNNFLIRNVILSLSGDWDLLRERSLTFLNENKVPRQYTRYIPEHEFYLALCNKDKIGMETALNKLLESRMAKKIAYYNDVFFGFYLQMQVVLYGKIASIHGFDLDIDSPIAPKELIKYDPLPHYEDPYDFMKEFDYNRPQQEWIDMWEERERVAMEREKKYRFLSWLGLRESLRDKQKKKYRQWWKKYREEHRKLEKEERKKNQQKKKGCFPWLNFFKK